MPIWIGDYVLAGYGTGAVMAVPCGDQRDYDFAKHFDIPIKNIFANADISEEAFSGKEGAVIKDSDFLSGLEYKEALPRVIEELEKIGAGKGKTNYRLRDAVFSRQRYWGEPFPVYYVNGLPQMIDEKYLPLRLPDVEKYLPTEEGEPPLGRAKNWYWNTKTNEIVSPPSEGMGEDIYPLELNTMPGWAGSSWYLFRYMDPHNEDRFVSKEAQQYWENVDLYIGGK
ncbi:class I tRNA ligase family protein [Antarcticibacterium sp. 1MA-6-2]|nr:class I tRNA ligase family protein [Antarcticibacterium sp. 1MA-6-2]